MAEANGNNQANVSSAKGVKGGYIFSAPEGTALPTDIKTPLDPAFKCLGFISEDGYVETVDEDSDDIPDMNGDIMDSTNSNRVESRAIHARRDQGRDAQAPIRREERDRRERRHHGQAQLELARHLQLRLGARAEEQPPLAQGHPPPASPRSSTTSTSPAPSFASDR